MITRRSIFIIFVVLIQSCMTNFPANATLEVKNQTHGSIEIVSISGQGETDGMFVIMGGAMKISGNTFRIKIEESVFNSIQYGRITFKIVCEGGIEIDLDGSMLNRKVTNIFHEMGATYYIENCREQVLD